jgi:hypothetical protein
MTPTDEDENENDQVPFSPALLPFGLLIDGNYEQYYEPGYVRLT